MTEQELESRLEYVIKHEPIVYRVERKWLFFWAVVNIRYNKPASLCMSKSMADIRCELFNAIFSAGYSVGARNVVNAIFDTTN